MKANNTYNNNQPHAGLAQLRFFCRQFNKVETLSGVYTGNMFVEDISDTSSNIYHIVVKFIGCLWLTEVDSGNHSSLYTYRVAQNKIPHQTICNISATGGLILKILEAA